MKTRAHKGFTLIELIVVISIIALLVGIIGPSVSKVRELGFKAKSTAAIQELASGAMQYKSEYNYYPLQAGWPSSTQKASRYFGASMLGYIVTSTNNDPLDPSVAPIPVSLRHDRKPFIAESNDRFLNATTTIKSNRKTGATVSAPEYTPLDQWKKGDEMAVLYYPSNIGNDGGLTSTSPAFTLNANDFYTDGQPLPHNNSGKLKMVDDKFGASNERAFNSDSFLLIAAGPDGEYFTEDDIKNF